MSYLKLKACYAEGSIELTKQIVHAHTRAHTHTHTHTHTQILNTMSLISLCGGSENQQGSKSIMIRENGYWITISNLHLPSGKHSVWNISHGHKKENIRQNESNLAVEVCDL